MSNPLAFAHSSKFDEARRRDRDELVRLLESQGCQIVRDKTLCCPFHADSNPSASIHQRDSGVWALHCFVCDTNLDIYDVEARYGLSIRNPTPDTPRAAKVIPMAVSGPKNSTDKKPVIYPTAKAAMKVMEASFGMPMTDGTSCCHPDTGKPEAWVYRFEAPGKEKKFCQVTPIEGGWVNRGLRVNPIYNRLAIRTAESVIVVEGELKMKALCKLGFVATSAIGGSNSAGKTEWAPLAGKTCYLWPDNDPPDPKRNGVRTGIKHMEAVAAALAALEPPSKIFMISPDDLSLPPKGDAVDYLAANPGTKEEQRQAIQIVLSEAAAPWGVAPKVSEYEGYLARIMSGKYRSIAWPWERLTRLSNSLCPESVTMVSGDPGCGKSLFTLQGCIYWREQQHELAIFELEKSRNFHMNRAHAMLYGDSSLTDSNFLEANPAYTQRSLSEIQDEHDGLGRCMDEAPGVPVDMDHMIGWVEKKAKAGAKIILIDPITAISKGLAPWLADNRFVLETRQFMEKYGSRMILVNHPSNSDAKKMAGGAAYNLFSDSIFWIKRLDKEEELEVQESVHLTHRAPVNRRIYLKKCRLGKGAGFEVGYLADHATLRFAEQGLIVDEKKTGRGGR